MSNNKSKFLRIIKYNIAIIWYCSHLRVKYKVYVMYDDINLVKTKPPDVDNPSIIRHTRPQKCLTSKQEARLPDYRLHNATLWEGNAM